MTIWQALEDEVLRWQDLGKKPDLWWRDDDAVADTAALQDLLTLTEQANIPLMLAIIPAQFNRSLLNPLTLPRKRIMLAVHGFNHDNKSAAQDKKCEFPLSRLDDDGAVTLFVARQYGQIWENIGWRGSDIFVPPWNRLDSAWHQLLIDAGFRGLSQFGSRSSVQSDDLVICNTHVDIIDWHNRCFLGTEPVLQGILAHLQARRLGPVDAAEPTGILTHHLAHDTAAWDFLDQFCDWAGARDLVWRAPFDA